MALEPQITLTHGREMPNLFVYGSLMLDDVLASLIDDLQSISKVKGVLNGYSSYMLKGYNFPAIVIDGNSSVSGFLLQHMSAQSLTVLDAFELNVYERVSCNIETELGLLVGATTYVLGSDYFNMLSNRKWDLEYFELHHLRSYKEFCKDWKKNYEDGLSISD